MKAKVISPKDLRIAQIVLGVIDIALSISVIAQPRAGVTLLVFLLSIILLVLPAGIGLKSLPK